MSNPRETHCRRASGDEWIATSQGLAGVGRTNGEARKALKDALKLKTALQIIYTWSIFRGGQELDPIHVERLISRSLDPFK